MILVLEIAGGILLAFAVLALLPHFVAIARVVVSLVCLALTALAFWSLMQDEPTQQTQKAWIGERLEPLGAWLNSSWGQAVGMLAGAAFLVWMAWDMFGNSGGKKGRPDQ